MDDAQATVLDTTRVLEVHDRTPMLVPAQLGLRYRDGQPIDPDRVVANTNAMLYWLDDSRRCAVFAELPSDMPAAEQVFLGDTQHARGVRYYAMPYDVFHRLAQDLPAPATLIFLHSTGRCGSTLLYRLFNAFEGTVAVSEPVFYSQTHWWTDRDRAEKRRFVDSATRMLARSSKPTFVVKLPSEDIRLFDLFAECFPAARQLFMYRNARDTLLSYARALSPPDLWKPMPRHAVAWVAHYFPSLRRFIDRPQELSWSELLAIRWLQPVQYYLATLESGGWAGAIRYEDLVADPIAMTARLAELFRLPPIDDQSVKAILASDAQAGSFLSREVVETRGAAVSAGQLEPALQLVAEQLSPDVVLPGTLSPR